MRVLVFEAGSGGHSFNYLRLLLPALHQLVDQLVVVVGKGALDTPFAKAQLQVMPSSIEWDQSVPTLAGSHFRRQSTVRRALQAAVARHRPNHVYVPTADSVSQMLGLAAAAGRHDFPVGVEAEAALHRCGFVYPVPSWRKRMFYRVGYWTHARAPWTRLFNVDVVAYDWIQRRGGPLAERTFLLPDPVETPPAISLVDARRKLGLPLEGQLIGCTGMIDERKGCDLLLAAFCRARLPDAVRLVLAGCHSESIKNSLRSEYVDLVKSGRILSIDRYLGVDELQYAIASLDLVCTPYHKQYAIASIVVRAAAAGRPVLATNFGWCGRMVPSFRLGWTCDVHHAAEFARAIAESLERVGDWKRSAASLRLLQFHTPENFAAVFTGRLRERLGLPPLPATVSWLSVEQAASSTRPNE